MKEYKNYIDPFELDELNRPGCIVDITSKAAAHILELRAEIYGLKAQRMAYANEFPRDELLEILEAETDIISNELVDNSRWAIIYELIFKYDGKIYRAHYRRGATECQDESPWEYEDMVDCVEVVPTEKVVIVYVDA